MNKITINTNKLKAYNQKLPEKSYQLLKFGFRLCRRMDKIGWV